jgi:hypothetical protein
MIKSYSQSGQDEYVAKTLDNLQDGYFLEVGAWNGIEFSNTYALEQEYRWTGLLVECDPAVTHVLKTNRPKSIIDNRAVWSKSNEEVTFKSVDGGKLSGAVDLLSHPKGLARNGKMFTINTISLNDLLEYHKCPKHINYFSIDVEGSEYTILSTYDFSHTFDVITIEHWNDKDAIYDLLNSKGYKIAKTLRDVPETIFVRK